MSGNLGPACRHDHDAKTVGGWTVRQHRPGCFTWTSPTGNQYRGRAARVIPELPDPLPPEQRDRSDPLPSEYADHGPLWHNAPYPRQPDPPQDDQGGREPDEPPF